MSSGFDTHTKQLMGNLYYLCNNFRINSLITYAKADAWVIERY